VTRLGTHLGLSDLWIKDESQLPTGSFKSRGIAMAVTMAKHFGIKRLAIPTAGNAGGALAAYVARAGLEAFVFMPRDTPIINQIECALAGARTFLVNGLINDCGSIVRAGKDQMNWFDCSTLKEPYRIEGKKTMGLELAEQFDWQLPDVIVYQTGGGTGLIGMWKAFHELRTLGWLKGATGGLSTRAQSEPRPLGSGPKLPRMVSVQSDGCAPIVRAFEKGDRFAEPWKNARTSATGLRVPAAVGDFMILDAIRQSGGCAVAVEESQIIDAMKTATAFEGIPLCPESAACILAIQKLKNSGWLGADERIVLFNTATAQKYVEAAPIDLPLIEGPSGVDFGHLGHQRHARQDPPLGVHPRNLLSDKRSH
jgi:threonine synthase